MKRGSSIDRARSILKAAGSEGAEIKETTPQFGGLRSQYVQRLVDKGEAEWIVKNKRARLRGGDL